MAIDDLSADVKRPGFLPAAMQTFGAQVGVAFLSLGNVLIVSRALGPSGRGSVAFLTAIAMISSNLATMGIHEANVNLAGSEPRLRRALAGNSLLLSAVFGALAIAAVVALMLVAPRAAGGADPLLLALTLSSLPILVLNSYVRALLQGEYGFSITNATYALPALINVGVNGTLALVGHLTVGVAVITWIAGQTIATGIMVWYLARRSGGFGRPSMALVRSTLGFGTKSHIGRVMLLGNYRLDQWILGAIAGPSQLGVYSVAVALAEALFLLPTSLAVVQRPDLVRVSHDEAVRQSSAVFRNALLLTAVAGIILILLAPFIVVGLFGDAFDGAINQLRVLVCGAFGIVALKQLGSALVARQKPTLSSLAIGSAFVSTVVLDLLLIPHHGGMGAAIASTVSYTFGGIVVVVIFMRSLGGTRQELVPRADDARGVWALVRNAIAAGR
jgi:O-antigen/teichoic acid export membrane protein